MTKPKDDYDALLGALVTYFVKSDCAAHSRLMEELGAADVAETQWGEHLRVSFADSESYEVSEFFVIHGVMLLSRVSGKKLLFSRIGKVGDYLIKQMLGNCSLCHDQMSSSLRPIVALFAIKNLAVYGRLQNEATAHRTMRPSFRSFHRPYLRVLAGALKDLKRVAPSHYWPVAGIILSDLSDLYLGISKDSSRRGDLLRKVRSNLSRNQSGENLISLFALNIDDVRRVSKSDPLLAIEKALDLVETYNSDKVLYCSKMQPLIDLQYYLFNFASKVRIRKFHRQALLLIDFVENNLAECDLKHRCELLKIHVRMGMIFLASGQGSEASLYLSKAHKELVNFSKENELVSRYLKYKRLILETAIAQAELRPKDATVCMKLALQAVEEIKYDWRYWWREPKMERSGPIKRLAKRVVNLLDEVRMAIDERSSCYRQFTIIRGYLEASVPAGKSQFDNLIKTMTRQAKIVESGYELRPNVGEEGVTHRFNLGELLFDTYSLNYISIAKTKYRPEEFTGPKITEFYNKWIKGDAKDKIHAGYGLSLGQNALWMCREPDNIPPGISASSLLLFALKQLLNDMSILLFSTSTVVFEYMAELSRVLARSGDWPEQDARAFAAVIEKIFSQIEDDRNSVLHEDDRAIADKMLETCYTNIVLPLIKAASSSQGRAGKRLVDIALVFHERAGSRWLDCSYPRDFVETAKLSGVSIEQLAEFLYNEEALRNFLSSRGRSVVAMVSVDREKKAAPSELRGISGRKNKSGDKLGAYAADYRDIRQKYIVALIDLQKRCPGLDWNLKARLNIPIEPVILRFRNNLAIHLIDVLGEVKLICCFRKSYRIFHLDVQTQELSKHGKYLPLWIACRKGDAPPYCEHFREAKGIVADFLARKSTRRETRDAPVVIFVQPELSTVPLRSILLTGYGGDIIHSFGVQNAAKNLKRNSSTQQVVMIAPKGNLRFVELEVSRSWRNRFVVCGQMEPRDVVDAMDNATVLHYSGHLYDNSTGGLYCPVRGGKILISCRWIIENLNLRRRPLVILNACRSGLAHGQGDYVNFQRGVSFTRDEELARRPASYANAFLAAGAACVVATTAPIDDAVAFIFAWRLCGELESGHSKSVEDAFRKAKRWCRLIDSDIVTAGDIEVLFDADKESSGFLAARLQRRIKRVGKRHLLKYGIDCWEDFIIYR